MSTVAESATPKTASNRFSGAQHRLFAFSGLIVLMLFFSLASPNFMQTANMITILQATSVNGVLAIAATLVIISGGIDLSVGTLMTFCSVIAGVLLTFLGLPMAVGVAGALLGGAACGAVSGVFIAKLKIPPFIATLGMMLIYKGLSLAICGAKPIYFNDTPGFTKISTGSLIGDVIPALPIPNGVLILFLVAIAAAFILARTVLGRFIFALGSNEEALRLSGVNIDHWKIAVYGLAGGVCGVAGILIASRINSAQPAIGLGYELDAIAIAAIDSQATVPLLQQAKDANIPVIAFDSGVDSDIPITSCSTDNLASAALAADKMAELIGGEGKVGIVSFDQTSQTGIERRDGFVEQIKTKSPKIEIVGIEYGGGDHLKSAEITKTMLQANPDLKGIFGTNEGAAIGVSIGKKEAGSNIVVIGYDSGAAQIAAVRDGTIAGAITQNPVGIGYKSVEAAVKAIKGETVEKHIDTGFYWYDKTNIDDPKIAAVLYN